jgi:hypothetical protein
LFHLFAVYVIGADAAGENLAARATGFAGDKFVCAALERHQPRFRMGKLTGLPRRSDILAHGELHSRRLRVKGGKIKRRESAENLKRIHKLRTSVVRMRRAHKHQASGYGGTEHVRSHSAPP